MRPTRIRIEEYNDGTKKYFCEVDNFNREKFWNLFATILLIPHAIILQFGRQWTRLNYYNGKYKPSIIEGGLGTAKYDDYGPAIYDTELQAKLFLDNFVKEQEAAELATFNAKVKTTTFKKYP